MTKYHFTGNLKFLSTLSLRRATRAHPSSQAKPQFLSTLSLRRATVPKVTVITMALISIHALLAESDIHLGGAYLCIVYFYPRSPCGERLKRATKDQIKTKFLSTLSLRRATFGMLPRCLLKRFLSTLSLRRATGADRPRG